MPKLNVVTALKDNHAALEAMRALGGVEVIALPDQPHDELIDAAVLAQADVLCVSCIPSNMDDAPNVKLVQIGSAGFETLLPLDLPGRGVRACNALGVFDAPIAEWTIAMIINLGRDLRQMIRNQELAVWDRDARFQREIRGSVVGLWGYGGIGRAVARLAKGMGLTVHTLTRGGIKSRHDKYCVDGAGDPDGTLPDPNFSMDERDAFLASLDFLALAMPLTPATQGVVDASALAALRPDCYLLNPARGPLVDEAALIESLGSGAIAGAALDTHYHYPMPADHPLWRMPNVIMTPHISGSDSSQHYADRIWEIATRNVHAFATGGDLINELTPSQLRGE